VREEVAKYPGRHELIEIDIEDPMVGWQMEEAFGTSHTCWGKKNTAKHYDTVICLGGRLCSNISIETAPLASTCSHGNNASLLHVSVLASPSSP
jgi:hypothetical protein